MNDDIRIAVKSNFKIIYIGSIFYQVAGLLSLILSIILFFDEVSILFPISILIIQILSKVIAILSIVDDSSVARTNFAIMELLYLSFLGIKTNAQFNLIRNLIYQHYIFSLPMQVILIQLTSNKNLSKNQLFLSYSILALITCGMILQLKYKSHIRFYSTGQFQCLSVMLKLVLLGLLLLTCSWYMVVVYSIIILVLYLLQNYIVLLYLSGKFNIYHYNKINIFLNTLLEDNQGTNDLCSSKLQHKFYFCSKITILVITIKCIILAFFVLYFEEYALFYTTLIFQFEMLQPHINSIVHYNSANILIQRFSGRKELLEYLQKREQLTDIVIDLSYNKRKNVKGSYEYLAEIENEQDPINREDELRLLHLLSKYHFNNKIVSIDQFGIQISQQCFVVEKCVSMQALYEFLYEVKSIPSPYLFAGYLGLNFFDIYMNRILLLTKKQNESAYNTSVMYGDIYVNLNSMYTTLLGSSLSINLFCRDISSYLTINPTSVLYDFYQ